jgi:glycerol-3-phosphate acyltransferase PlsX
MAKPKFGIDLMGGDIPPHILLKGVLDNLSVSPMEACFLFYCDEDHFPQIENEIRQFKIHHPLDATIVACKDVITSQDSPLIAVKTKKNSSMSLGILDLNEKKIDAFMTVGNTGALLALAHFHLNVLPGIKRPALMAHLPTSSKPVALMDVGANTHASSELLFQFALMGIAYLRATQNNDFTLGILNIGSEEHKGTSERKETIALLKEFQESHPELLPNFYGNIEPREVFQGKCDLVITDGFSGNIFLKSAEGTSHLIMNSLKESGKEVLTKDQLKKLMTVLNPFFEHEVYPGALLTGVDGIVLKCHSYLDGKAIYQTILHANDLIQGDFLSKIKKNLF